ncbi:MAG: hypothetical protein LAO06_09315 [Acidobacteriia bacterium]|nr:hypothetical protein [Terriglobia bacterium]
MTSSAGSSSFSCGSRCALLLAITLAWPVAVAAQNCLTGDDLDSGPRNALEQTAQSFVRMSAAGDYASLKAAAIPSLAASFGGVEAAVTEHKPDFSGAQASPSAMYVLENATKATLERAEFYCGIFNSQDRVFFVIPNLSAGRFAVVTEDVSGGRQPVRLSLVLQQQGNRWALAGYTVKPTQVAGHDLNWYLSQVRQYKSRGQNMAAYLYCLEAWYLSQPVEIEYTVQQDKLADEMQQARPTDFPSPNQPMILTAGGKTYRVTQLFPDGVGNDLDLIVKYRATSDISNTAAAFQDNMAVIKAIVARYPELRAAFAGVVARAVDPSGRDYGSLLAMKDVK